MCGIVGYVGERDSVPIMLDGLRRLEYRGYDSAGVAVAGMNGLSVHKTSGKVRRLAESLPVWCRGGTGIGHTRWATHGEPNDTNAHPHLDHSGRFAVVHNGIIENATELRSILAAEGTVLRSTTDSEVLAHLISRSSRTDLEERVADALVIVEGTYGLAVLDAWCPDRIVIARNGSPVVVGFGEHEHFVASDIAALAPYVEQVVHLEDGEIGVATAQGYTVLGSNRPERRSRPRSIITCANAYDRGAFSHFMRKEIAEQPEAVARTLDGRLDQRRSHAVLADCGLGSDDLSMIRRVKFLGCGSAYYAGMSGAFLVEALTGIPADAEAASEFRYRQPIVEKDTLYMVISQSGETLDTLRSVQEVQRQGAKALGIVNVMGSSIARQCDGTFPLRAGPEVSVAATKSFSCTIAATAVLAAHLGQVRGVRGSSGQRVLQALAALPDQIAAISALEPRIADTASWLAAADSAFFIGRVEGYPIAREGAQKLKEVSYIHAEAYPASELKHGPLALVAPGVPTVAVVPDDRLYAKNVSTLEEIRSRRGPIVAVGHTAELDHAANAAFLVPKSEPELDPLLLNVPLQLLAYHAAVILGYDVDQPRNLAKSVTVE